VPGPVFLLAAMLGLAAPGPARDAGTDGDGAPDRLCLAADAPAPGLVAQFGAWPLACTFDRAGALGLSADADLAALLRDGLPSSVLLP